jgi:hypothetical protein
MSIKLCIEMRVIDDRRRNVQKDYLLFLQMSELNPPKRSICWSCQHPYNSLLTSLCKDTTVTACTIICHHAVANE